MAHGRVSEAERQRRLAAYKVKMKTIIERNGWLIQGVFPVNDGELGFSYTIGLTEKGLPELVVSGFFDEIAQNILDAAGTRHEEHLIDHGDVVPLLGDAEFRAINAPLAHLGFAYAMYGPTVRAIQLVWPDDNGFYPGSAFVAKGQQELFGLPWW